MVRNLLPRLTAEREAAFVKLSTALMGRDRDTISALIASSPLTTRDPEAQMLWHPLALRQPQWKQISQLLGQVITRAIPRGLVKTLRRSMNYHHHSTAGGDGVLGVSPGIIAQMKDGQVHTSYTLPEDTASFSWLIFHHGDKKFSVGIIKYLTTTLRLVWRLRRAHNGWQSHQPHSWIALITYLHWCIGGYYLTELSLNILLKKICKEQKPKGLFCVHEFHSHAKIVWYVGHCLSIKSQSVLHAPASRSKLWLFPSREELQASGTFPDYLSVYHPEDAQLLGPRLPRQVRFPLACGPRFVGWKGIKPLDRQHSGSQVLLVSSLSWWDNEAVLQATKRLISQPMRHHTLYLRLHPHAQLRPEQTQNLHQLLRHPAVKHDQRRLDQAIAESHFVIGLGSSVLEEAMVMGVPAFAIDSEDFLSFASTGVERIELESLSMDRLLKPPQKSDQPDTEYFRARLGLDQPAFRWQNR